MKTMQVKQKQNSVALQNFPVIEQIPVISSIFDTSILSHTAF